MKAILMSIRPQWVEKILNGEKTIEVRKRFPKDYVGWVYIYCTMNGGCIAKSKNKYVYYQKGYTTRSGKVVARFWCDKVEDYVYGHKWSWENGAPMWGADNSYEKILKDMCLTDDELKTYVDDLCFSAIHITKLEIFDKPKEIYEMKRLKHFGIRNKCEMLVPITSAPQNYCYIEL